MFVFNSLPSALAAGFHIFERTSEGYTMRTRYRDGWALALVRVRV
jgi:hypothetical protein